MKNLVPMTEKEFDELFRVRSLDEISEEELDIYAERFVDLIRNQVGQEAREGIYWCPKCESHSVLVAIDEDEDRALVSCPGCRMAIIVVATEEF